MRAGESVMHAADGGDLAWPIRRAAALFGSSEAVVEGDLRLDYAELDRRVWALAGALDRTGVAAGGRVGYLGVNSIPHLEAWFAIPASGRVLVDLNVRLAETELEFMINDCDVELLIVDAERLEIGRRLRERCPSLRELVLADGDGADDAIAYARFLDHAPAAYSPLPREQLAAICYTGGTTGLPKGVMLTHGNLLANATHNLVATGHTSEDRWLHVPPMFHVAGTANVFACTWAGSRQVIAPRFEARAFIDVVRRERITHCVLVPTMLRMLLTELEADTTGEGLPSLRHIQYAASPITPALQREVLEYFDCEIVQMYGMTEAAPSVTKLSGRAHRLGVAGGSPHAERLTSVGRAIVGVEVSVVGPDGKSLPPGAVGELCVRGPNVMAGYWNREDATAAALDGGWYHTGDAVRMDEDGYIFLVDRLKDMIITGGENVYSIEVEAALAEHPAVAEAAVFGVPDPRWGEAVHAVVSIRAGQEVSADELIAHCRSLIAGYKIPRAIELRHEPLPKSGAGKILKSTLREPYWSGHERRVH